MSSCRVPARSLVLGAAVSVQIDAPIATSLVDELPRPAVVLLRLGFGSAAVCALVRPRLRRARERRPAARGRSRGW